MVGEQTVAVPVPHAALGMRLDVFLASLAQTSGAPPPIAQLSRARLAGLLRAGAGQLNGGSACAKRRLHGGEQLLLRLPPPVPLGLTPVPMDLQVIYEDDDLVAIDKPAGLVVHPGANTQAPTLVHGLLAHCRVLSGIGGIARPGIVHRLDRDTSGVMVVAKHDRSHVALGRQFAQRSVMKRYIAVVHGVPTPAQASLDTPYGRHRRLRQRFTGRAAMIAQGAQTMRRARTAYAVLHAGRDCSVVHVHLLTGRTHQIRVHMSEAGHPLLGDAAYGGAYLARLRAPGVRAAARTMSRTALHAEVLEITHPCSGALLKLQAPLPPPMSKLVAAVASSTY